MTDFSAVQAARHLGVSERGLREQIRRGELTAVSVDPVRLDPQHVRLALALQQQEILARLARKRQSPVSLALDVRARLHPKNPGTALPQHAEEDRRRRLSLVPDDARRLLGGAALEAASEPDDSGCRWCRAAELAADEKRRGWWAPQEYAEGFQVLFDQAPCEVCRPRLCGVTMARLAARVHPGGRGPSEGRVAPSAAERAAAREWALQHPVTAAARPMRDDDNGRGLVQRRLREARARLKTAKRANDQKYAIRLAQQIRALEADAARVDGRAVTASARPGTLRCGHRLDAGCSCPRRASR